jgi:hypothetical protein
MTDDERNQEALFRHAILGDLLSRNLRRGQLRPALQQLARETYQDHHGRTRCVACKPLPRLWRGCMILKLSQAPSQAQCLNQRGWLKSEEQRGSAAKTAFVLGAFLPDCKPGSGNGDCIDGGGIVLNKDKVRPRWGDCVVSPPGPSQVEFKRKRLA